MSLRREFSKQFAQDERDQLASDIDVTKKQHNQDRDNWTEKQVVESGHEVKKSFEELKTGFFEKLFKTEAYQEKQKIWAEVMHREKNNKIEQLQQDFEKKLSDIISEIPLSPEEQDKYLSEEGASNLALEDYLLLMDRLSGRYVSHITRFGIREQTFKPLVGGHWAHENEFLDNFTGILKSKELQGFISSLIDRTDYTRESVVKHLEMVMESEPEASKEDIINQVAQRLFSGNAISHEGDKDTVHVASGDVAASRYGSEFGYDIYFYYPAEIIGKNYAHNHSLDHSMYNDNSSGYNDIMVWNKGKGIPIDVGLCCIPGNVQVDRETGSQYMLDDDKKPILSETTIKHVDYFRTHRKKFEDAFSTLNQLRSDSNRDNYEDKKTKYNQELERLSSELGFNSLDIFRKFFNSYGHVYPIDLEEFYKEQQLYYQQPNNKQQISSEEYWEQYFKNHPNEKPSKIVYYHSSDGYKFTPRPKQTEEKDAVMRDLDSTSQFKNISDHPDYRSYKTTAYEEVKKVISETYDQIKTRD